MRVWPSSSRASLPWIVAAAAAAMIHLSTSEGASSSAVTFTLFDNGSSAGGIDVTLNRDEFPAVPPSGNRDEGGEDGEEEGEVAAAEAFALRMSRLVDVSKYGADKPVAATRAFREDGKLVATFDDLEPDSEATERRRVYLVADDLEFVWPYVSFGNNQTIHPDVLSPADLDGDPVVLESLSDSPRVFRVHNMFTTDEASALIDNALSLTGELRLKRSTVGVSTTDSVRTSDNAWDSESEVAEAMISRSFRLTRIEEDAGKVDGLQIVRYEVGQGYITHPDYFAAGSERRSKEEGMEKVDFNPYSGGSNRYATVFMYLNDVEEGGSTVFPRAPSVLPPELRKEPPRHALDMFEEGSWQQHVTRECHSKLAIPPLKGTAALFYSITPDGRIDHASHHGACPVIGGTKWGANIWIWNKQRYGEVKTGKSRSMDVVNAHSETVFLSWEGRDNGSIPPGRSVGIGTFQFHRFKAHLGNHQSKAFAEFTVQPEPEHQVWTIRSPKARPVLDVLEDAKTEEGEEL